MWLTSSVLTTSTSRGKEQFIIGENVLDYRIGGNNRVKKFIEPGANIVNSI